MTTKLTETSIRALPVPATGETFIRDELAGFGVRVRATGGKTYEVRFTSPLTRKTTKHNLGKVGVMTLAQARDAAKLALGDVAYGHDPARADIAVRDAAKITFGSVLPRYLDAKRKVRKPRAYEEIARALQKHAKPLHPLPITAITRAVVAGLLTDIETNSGPGARNGVRANLSAFFNWTAEEALLPDDHVNPVERTRKTEIASRKRVLNDAELGAIWSALRADDHGDIVKLLTLTGLRRDEIGGLRWDEIDIDGALITLTGDRTKTGADHLVPLNEPALAILKARAREGAFVFGRRDNSGFSGWSRAKAELDARIAETTMIKPWRLHDLRRTLSTTLGERYGVLRDVREAILGHVIPGVAGVYDRAEYLEARKAALATWGKHVTEVTTGKAAKSNVVKLPVKAKR